MPGARRWWSGLWPAALGLVSLAGCARTYDYVSGQVSYLFTRPEEPALADVSEPPQPAAPSGQARRGAREQASPRTAAAGRTAHGAQGLTREPAVALALPQAEPEPAGTPVQRNRQDRMSAPPLPVPPKPARLAKPSPAVAGRGHPARQTAHKAPPSAKPSRDTVTARAPSAPAPPGSPPKNRSRAAKRDGARRTALGATRPTDAARLPSATPTKRPSPKDLRKGNHRPGAAGLRRLLEHLFRLAQKRQEDKLGKAMEQLQAERADLAFLLGPERGEAVYLPYAYRQRRMRDQAKRELVRRAARGNTRFHVKAAARGVLEGSRARLYRKLYGWLRKDVVLYRVYFQTDRMLTEDGPFVYVTGRWLHLFGLGSSMGQD